MNGTAFIKATLPVIAGVILAGVLLDMGYRNNWPVIKQAANGFDQ